MCFRLLISWASEYEIESKRHTLSGEHGPKCRSGFGVLNSIFFIEDVRAEARGTELSFWNLRLFLWQTDGWTN